MDKICLIKQPYGLGDIIFTLKLAKMVQERSLYKRVIWPVAAIYCYLNEYLIADGMEFCFRLGEFPHRDLYDTKTGHIVCNEDLLFMPLHNANVLMGRCKCCQATFSSHMKYDMCNYYIKDWNVGYEDWLDYFNFRRNHEKENKLFAMLGLNTSTKYNLVNENHLTFPLHVKREGILPVNSYRNVMMDFYEGFTVFDWSKVFEHAYEIHTVATSVPFILEKLNLQNVYIYSRFGKESDFREIKSNNNPGWKYIG
jgi:hypothetical protein